MDLALVGSVADHATARMDMSQIPIVDNNPTALDVLDFFLSLDGHEIIPITMLTARTTDNDIWEGDCAGVVSYIARPLAFVVLQQKIDRLT